MATHKPLSARINPKMKEFNNSNTKTLSIKLPISSLTLEKEFVELFPLNEKMVNQLAENMRINGYDESKPIDVWERENESIVIDGHTRLAATKKLGFFDIPVCKHHFDSIEEAMTYAYSLQINRRNLDDTGILLAVEKLDSLKTPGKKSEDNVPKGRSSQILAEKLGVSNRKIERTRQLLSNAPKEIIDAVKKNEITVNKGLTLSREAKKEKEFSSMQEETEKFSKKLSIKENEKIKIFKNIFLILEKENMQSAVQVIFEQTEFLSEKEREQICIVFDFLKTREDK